MASSAQTAPRIGDADRFGGWARIVADALGELAVAFAQVVGAHVFGFHLTVSRHCDWTDTHTKRETISHVISATPGRSGPLPTGRAARDLYFFM